jgi:hypothetical protein
MKRMLSFIAGLALLTSVLWSGTPEDKAKNRNLREVTEKITPEQEINLFADVQGTELTPEATVKVEGNGWFSPVSAVITETMGRITQPKFVIPDRTCPGLGIDMSKQELKYPLFIPIPVIR